MVSRRSFLGGVGAGALALPLVSSAAPARAAGPDWSRLSRHLSGGLVLPGDGGYATAKQLSTAEFDTVNPRAVAYCATPADVALCLAFASDHGLPIAPRSGGHSAGGYSTTTGLVIDVGRLNAVSVGPAGVTAGAGAQMVDVTNALAPHGLAVSGGFSPSVALGGYLQGGGIGLLTRHVGIASDKVTAAQVVLADGRVVRASATEHPDLYWAIRGGGGGNFGVVTAYDISPTPLTTLTLGTLQWGYDAAADVLDGYARWLPGAPRTLGGSALATLPDAAPGNIPTVSVLISSVGTADELAAETARLIALVGRPPTVQNSSTAPYLSVMMRLYGCGTTPVDQCRREPTGVLRRAGFAVQRGRLFSAPPSRTMWTRAVALLDQVRVAGQQHMIQVGSLGGAANDLRRTDTAYVHRDSQFAVSFLGTIPGPADPAARAAAQQWADSGFATVDPYSNRETYQNFIDPRLRSWRSAYYAENYPRLVAVKRRYDPHCLFSFAQSVG